MPPDTPAPVRFALVTGATPRARLLFAAGLAALLAAVAAGRPALVAFAAVCLAPLVLATRNGEAVGGDVVVEPPSGPFLEDDPVDVLVRVTLDRPAALLTARLATDGGVSVDEDTASARITDGRTLLWTARLTPGRWGAAQPPSLHLTTRDAAGLRRAHASVTLPLALVVMPRPAPVSPLTAVLAGRARTGNHVGRRAGEGVEFAGLRPFVPGDAARRIHWPASSRRGSLYVTERLAESAVDVVLVVDTLVDDGPPGASTLDVSLRGATGLARALLRNGDRVGLVLVGGTLSWLVPSSSPRHWYRLAAAALSAAPRESYVTPDVGRVPAVALPPGALVVVFTPLLDDRVRTVIADLRRRRFDVLVVDVLTRRPEPVDDTAVAAAGLRLWWLRRNAARRELTDTGCLVTTWDGTGPFDVPLLAALTEARRRPVRGGAR